MNLPLLEIVDRFWKTLQLAVQGTKKIIREIQKIGKKYKLSKRTAKLNKNWEKDMLKYV